MMCLGGQQQQQPSVGSCKKSSTSSVPIVSVWRDFSLIFCWMFVATQEVLGS
jgi:hypothetical protein